MSLPGPGLPPARPPAISARPRVIITTDCGTDMDDQWAIAHTALSDRLSLVGVIGEHVPNVPYPGTATNARDVLDHLRLAHEPPVFAGAETALVDTHTPIKNAAVDFIIEQAHLCTPQDPLNVYVIGPATDMASALLQDPSIEKNVRVIGMAFNNYAHGTDGWNVTNDVKAWQVLLSSHCQIAVGDGDTTLRDLMLSRDANASLWAAHGQTGKYLAGLFTQWLDNNPKMCIETSGSPDKWPVWDEVATGYLLGMTENQVLPRPVLNDDCTFSFPAGGTGQTITWVQSIDKNALFNDFTHRVDATNP